MDTNEDKGRAQGYMLRFRATMGTRQKSVTFPVPPEMLEHLRALVEQQRRESGPVFRVQGHRSMVVELAGLNFAEAF